ncbi:LysR family transcriptional regulator [Cysteiniphilum sp. QT6929]|uniref:LysR family transcriptional regulator n=1 Tax=Cysteiniphilum sp. QT6929 TaxID=2975055 RepID=UPI0024B332D2|nr:LysR family transcriptional regulator [Cysteiniphilum sp. QT6929]WHN65976.1 LysR family transcriptional regulator [Cysteiniphilum sp. QT6929]
MYTEFFTDALTLLDIIKIGSIAGLSDAKGEHRTTISRRIQRLEFHLKNTVITTKSGRVELTPYGSELIPRLQAMVQHMDRSFSQLVQKQQTQKMQVRFFNNIGVYYFFIDECLRSVLAINPDISIEMISYSYYQMLNFGSVSKSLFDQFDVIFIHDALIHLINDEEWLVKMRLQTTHKLYASEQYLKTHPAINDLQDLKKHICIYNNLLPTKSWLLQDEQNKPNEHAVTFEQSIGCDAVIMQYKLTKLGYGVSLIPESVVKSDHQTLVNILPNLSSKPFTTYLLVNSESYKNPIIKKVITAMIDTLNNLEYWG